MYDRIIVPVEENGGEEALTLARALARKAGSALTLLHVHHSREAPAELEGLPQYRYQHVVEAWDGLDVDEEAHEVEWLARKAADLAREEPELEVGSRVVHAPLARTLHEDHERLMVIALADGPAMGPTVREILRAGGVPVLLVPPGHAPDLRSLGHVLVALDGSGFSEEVVGPALELAAAIGARTSLVEVVAGHHGLAWLLRAGDRSAEAADSFLRDVRARLGERHGSLGIRVLQADDPAAALVTEAAREEGGLLALATHGRGGLRRLLMGSVAERVVAESALPVLIFRPTGAASPARQTETAPA